MVKCPNCGADIDSLYLEEAWRAEVRLSYNVNLSGGELNKTEMPDRNAEDELEELLGEYYSCPRCNETVAESYTEALDLLRGPLPDSIGLSSGRKVSTRVLADAAGLLIDCIISTANSDLGREEALDTLTDKSFSLGGKEKPFSKEDAEKMLDTVAYIAESVAGDVAELLDRRTADLQDQIAEYIWEKQQPQKKEEG